MLYQFLHLVVLELPNDWDFFKELDASVTQVTGLIT